MGAALFGTLREQAPCYESRMAPQARSSFPKKTGAWPVRQLRIANAVQSARSDRHLFSDHSHLGCRRACVARLQAGRLIFSLQMIRLVCDDDGLVPGNRNFDVND